MRNLREISPQFVIGNGHHFAISPRTRNCSEQNSDYKYYYVCEVAMGGKQELHNRLQCD